MCQILSFYEQDYNNSQLNRAEMLKNSQKSHSDGTGLVAFNPQKNEVIQKREMHLNSTEEAGTINKMPVVNIHTRTATSGKVKEKNIHFWEKHGWLFAHNGIVSSMSTAENTESDSKRFFNYLWGIGALGGKEPDIDAIKAAVDRKSLSGRFVLIDKDKSEAYYFGDYHTYLFDNELVISSEKEYFVRKESFWGAKLWKEGYTEQELEGIYKINFDKRKIEAIDEEYQIWGYGSRTGYKSRTNGMYNHTDKYGAYKSTATNYGSTKTEEEKENELTEEEKEIKEEYEKIVNGEVPDIEDYEGMEAWREEMKQRYNKQQLLENQAEKEHNTLQKRLTYNPKSY